MKLNGAGETLRLFAASMAVQYEDRVAMVASRTMMKHIPACVLAVDANDARRRAMAELEDQAPADRGYFGHHVEVQEIDDQFIWRAYRNARSRLDPDLGKSMALDTLP